VRSICLFWGWIVVQRGLPPGERATGDFASAGTGVLIHESACGRSSEIYGGMHGKVFTVRLVRNSFVQCASSPRKVIKFPLQASGNGEGHEKMSTCRSRKFHLFKRPSKSESPFTLEKCNRDATPGQNRTPHHVRLSLLPGFRSPGAMDKRALQNRGGSFREMGDDSCFLSACTK